MKFTDEKKNQWETNQNTNYKAAHDNSSTIATRVGKNLQDSH